MKLSIVIFALW